MGNADIIFQDGETQTSTSLPDRPKTMADPAALYRALYRIRSCENLILEKFPLGVFRGTTHTYLGQEANAVGVLANLASGDLVFSNHRSHGHFLAYGGDPHGLLAEIMGKATGVCGGRGGSQHLHWKGFYSNGVLGSTIPVAVGTALAEKFQRSGALTVAFLGDGALGEGVVYEAFNMASLWKVPILFVVENNRIAQTTPIELHLAGDIEGRFAAFSIPAQVLETSDVLDILPAAAEAMQAIRAGAGPRAIILHTHRFGPHSKGDDTRSDEELAHIRQEHDPLKVHGARIEANFRTKLETEVDQELNAAFEAALADLEPAKPEPKYPESRIKKQKEGGSDSPILDS